MLKPWLSLSNLSVTTTRVYQVCNFTEQVCNFTEQFPSQVLASKTVHFNESKKLMFQTRVGPPHQKPESVFFFQLEVVLFYLKVILLCVIGGW